MAKSAIHYPPFDVLAAIAEQLDACNISLEALSRVDAATVLEQISRDLALDLIDAPVEQQDALRVAAFTGYLAALGRGFQLGAMALEQSQSQMLDVASGAYNDGVLSADAYGFVLGMLRSDRTFVLPPSERSH